MLSLVNAPTTPHDVSPSSVSVSAGCRLFSSTLESKQLNSWECKYVICFIKENFALALKVGCINTPIISGAQFHNAGCSAMTAQTTAKLIVFCASASPVRSRREEGGKGCFSYSNHFLEQGIM